jgi:nucleotide-binding universal stress UspA family protein
VNDSKSVNNSVTKPVTYSDIIVPLSRPETVKNLVEIACDLLAEGGKLRLVNIIEVPPQLPANAETKKDRAKELLLKASEIAKNKGIEPSTEIVSARLAANAIVDLAKQYGSDLVLMGSSQRTVHQKLLFGNVVDRVLNDAHCDVIIYSYANFEQPVSYEKILVPTGYKGANRAMQIAIHFEKNLKGTITSIYVGSETEISIGDIIFTNVRRSVDLFGIHIDSLFRSGDVVDNIVETAKEGNYNLIVVVPKHRTLFFRALIGDKAREIVRRAPCNVMIIRAKN